MLLIDGTAALVAGLVLGITLGRRFPVLPGRPIPLTRQIADALAVALMFAGSLTMLVFFGELDTQNAPTLQAAVSGGIAVAGFVVTRLVRRRAPEAEAADRHRHAA